MQNQLEEAIYRNKKQIQVVFVTISIMALYLVVVSCVFRSITGGVLRAVGMTSMANSVVCNSSQASTNITEEMFTSDVLRIDEESGQVGVNTDPEYELDVEGSVRISDLAFGNPRDNEDQTAVVIVDEQGRLAISSKASGEPSDALDEDYTVTDEETNDPPTTDQGISESTEEIFIDEQSGTDTIIYQYYDTNSTQGNYQTLSIADNTHLVISEGNAVKLPTIIEKQPVEETVYKTEEVTQENFITNTVDDDDWVIDGNDMYTNISGNVGIGTSSPTSLFSVGNTSQLFSVDSSGILTNKVYDTSTGVCPTGYFWEDLNSNSSVDGGECRASMISNTLDFTTIERNFDSVSGAGVTGFTNTMNIHNRSDTNPVVRIGLVNGPSNTLTGTIESGSMGAIEEEGYIAFKVRNGTATPPEYMRITHEGNVGIGTSSPTSLFSVGNTSQLFSVDSSGILTNKVYDTSTGVCPTGYFWEDLNSNLSVDGGECRASMISNTLDFTTIERNFDSVSGAGVTGFTNTMNIHNRSDTNPVVRIGLVNGPSNTLTGTIESGSMGAIEEEGYIAFKVRNGTATPPEYMRITHEGNVGIGTTNPLAKLELADGGIVATGIYDGSNPSYVPSGAGARMMWIPEKLAFRAGYVDGNQWDVGNIGDSSTAWGVGTTASGFYATTWGLDTTASGLGSTAWGRDTEVSGEYATAWGRDTEAYDSHSTVFGRFNVIGTGNQTSWDSADQLFVIGNGADITNRNNALTLLKNGRLGLERSGQGTETIDYPIHVGTTTTDGNGAHLTAGGTWTNGSSRTFKEDFQPLDKTLVLEKVLDFEIYDWRYKNTDERGIAPFAEDFHNAFGLGTDKRYLSAQNVAGVALVAIQAQQDQIVTLESKVDILGLMHEQEQEQEAQEKKQEAIDVVNAGPEIPEVASEENVDLTSIEQEVTFNEPITAAVGAFFEGIVRFVSNVVFEGPVQFISQVFFEGEVIFANNTAGYATIQSGATEVDVTFETPFSDVPIVNITPQGIYDIKYAVTNVTTNGFTIQIQPTLAENVVFAWNAIRVSSASDSVSEPGADLSDNPEEDQLSDESNGSRESQPSKETSEASNSQNEEDQTTEVDTNGESGNEEEAEPTIEPTAEPNDQVGQEEDQIQENENQETENQDNTTIEPSPPDETDSKEEETNQTEVEEPSVTPSP